MNKRNKQIDVFNEVFLCESLNAFEGNSGYFKRINAHFATLLTTYFKHYDVDKSLLLIEAIKKERAYKGHPFFPFFIKYLSVENITKRNKEQVIAAFTTYPEYPLALYFKAMLSLPFEKRGINRKDNFLIIIELLNGTAKTIENLNELSAEGFAFATFELLKRSLEAGDNSTLEPLLSLLVEQNGGNSKETTILYLENLLNLSLFSNEVKQEIYRLLVKSGATNYIIPLVDLYEKSGNYTLAFFNLHLGHTLNIKEATSRLIAYYQSGKNIPLSEEIIKHLENN